MRDSKNSNVPFYRGVRYNGSYSTIAIKTGLHPIEQDDIRVMDLTWIRELSLLGHDWAFWSTPSFLNERSALGQRSSGSWCTAIYELLTVHYQRPALGQ